MAVLLFVSIFIIAKEIIRCQESNCFCKLSLKTKSATSSFIVFTSSSVNASRIFG